MELNEYQNKAMTTCMNSCDNFGYMALNLVAELGEFASKVAKQIRKGHLQIDTNDLQCVYLEDFDINDARVLNEALRDEAGDILWQLSGLCHVMGWRLEDVAQMNLEKLSSRKQRGVIDGSGDNR